jgi:hypothetical protein
MSTSQPSPILTKLAQAALEQAAQKPWAEVSLSQLCVAADVTLADCARDSVTKAHVAEKLDTDLDQAMLSGAAELDDTQSVRDRLFDVVMGRFDGMEYNRAAWQSILCGERGDALAMFARQARRVRGAGWALEACGVTATDLRGAGRAIGLARILRNCESVWREDGPDLAKTMARLDQDLRKGEAFIARTSDLSALFSGFGFKRSQTAKPETADAD